MKVWFDRIDRIDTVDTVDTVDRIDRWIDRWIAIWMVRLDVLIGSWWNCSGEIETYKYIFVCFFYFFFHKFQVFTLYLYLSFSLNFCASSCIKIIKTLVIAVQSAMCIFLCKISAKYNNTQFKREFTNLSLGDFFQNLLPKLETFLRG